jgi:carboxymethylenebutenolidase
VSETEYYGPTGAPLVVVLHDWFGRLPWLEKVALELAREGLQVAVPDFFDGRTAHDEGAARRLIDGIDIAAALSLIDDIIDEARLYGTERVGELGFSTGGWLALVHAQGGEVDAVVAYYASVAERHHGVIPCPLLLQYAESDEWEYGGDPQAFYERLADHGTPTSHFNYIATRHHFANASIAETADPQAAALALARTSAFLSAHLVE